MIRDVLHESPVGGPTALQKSWKGALGRWKIEMVVALGITILGFGIRLFLLNRYPVAPSSDFGNYLTQLHIIQGTDVEGVGLRYPPLFFGFLAPADLAMGGLMATKVLAAAVASSSCIPLFLIARRWIDVPTAAAVVALFTFSQAIAEMTAWGGSPNFLAMTFFVFVLYFTDRGFSGPGSLRANALAAGVFAGLVVLTHHLTMVVLAGTLILFFVFCFLRTKAEERSKSVSVLKWMAVSGVPVALPAVPVYYRMQTSLSSSLGSYGPPSLEVLFGPGGFHYILGVHWIAWMIIFILGAIMIVLRLHQRDWTTKTRLLIASSLAPVLLGLLVVSDAPGRVFMFLPIPLVIGFGLLIQSMQKWARRVGSNIRFGKQMRNAVLALFIADVVILSASGVQWMSESVDWYHPVEKGDLEGLNWIRDNTVPGDVVATSGKMLSGHREGDRLGWWIEGYSERRSVMAGSEMFRLFQDELESTRDMNRFYAGTNVLENGYLQVSDQYPISYRGNPEIAVRTAKIYQPVLFLNDATNIISYRTNSSSSEDINESFISASRSAYQVIDQGASITAMGTLNTSFASMSRSIELGQGERSAALGFRVDPIGGTELVELRLYLWASHGGTFKDVVNPSSVTHITVASPWDPDVPVIVNTEMRTGELASVTFMQKDPQWQLPVVEFIFTGNTSMDFTLEFELPSAHVDDHVGLAYYDAYDILSKYSVDYVFESTSMMLEIERFEKDPTHFQVAFRNNAVVIFKVL